MIKLLTSLLSLIAEAVAGRKSEEEVARALIDSAFDSGVPAAVLLQHLTDKGRERAELAADIAQWIKTGDR